MNALPKVHNGSGFTLIEVLVSLLILAIGLLGIAALQFKGLRYSNAAFIRSQINFLAYDIADRMRMNRANVDDYVIWAYTSDGELTGVYDPGLCNPLPPPGDARADLDCWKNNVNRALPAQGYVFIESVFGNPNLYTVTFDWRDAEGENHIVAYTFQP